MSWWFQKCKKKWGVTETVLEITCPEEHLNLSKSGFVSEETTVAASPKILQLALWREMFSAKNGRTKRV